MRNYNIQNESFIVSYYFNNFDSVNSFPFEKFQDLKLRETVKTLKLLKEEGLKFNLETVNSFIARNNGVKVSYQELLTLKDSYNDFTNINHHIEKLESDFSKQVVGTGLIKTLVSKVNSGDEIQAEELETELEQILSTLRNSRKKKSILKTSDDLADDYEQLIQERQNPAMRKSVGFKILDDKLVRPGGAKEIMIIAALRSMGKTTFKQNMINNLVKKGIPVVNFDLEMSQESSTDRLVTMTTGVSMMDLNKPISNKEHFDKIKMAMDDLRGRKNYIYSDKAGLSFKDINEELHNAKEIFRSRGVLKGDDEYVIFFLDVLNMVVDFKEQDPVTLLQALDKLNIIVKDHKSHCVGIVQINETMFRTGKTWSLEDVDNYRPTIEQIYGGSAYSQRARTVAILNRTKFLKELRFPEMKAVWEAEPDEMDFHCVKQSDGELFLQKFVFDGEKMRIFPKLEDNHEN